MRRVALVAGIMTLFAAGLLAQTRMSMPHGPALSGQGHSGVAAPGANRTSIRISGFPFREGFHRRPFRNNGFFFGGWPYLYPGDYYSDYDSYENELPPAPAPAPAAAPQAKQEPLPDPVLLELQGNQWVKVTNFAMPTNQTGTAFQTDAQPLAKEMPPAVLVYRDGHSEEVSSYSIIGTSIYTRSDYWSNGAWTRTIQIADLDIPATLKQNQQRGVKFDLPSGPDEVMIRP
jgi:hypothetical protein